MHQLRENIFGFPPSVASHGKFSFFTPFPSPAYQLRVKSRFNLSKWVNLSWFHPHVLCFCAEEAIEQCPSFMHHIL